MATNMLTRSLGRLLILRENADPPSDAEWDECLRLLSDHRHDYSKVKVLVVTEGGGPTPEQRKRLSRTTEGQPIHVAVVTDSMKVRFIVSSVALFLREIASFRRGDLHGAFAHLNLDAHEMQVAERALAEMDGLVSPGQPRGAAPPSLRRP